jgi:outer membrane immunogenic protein
MRIVILAGVAAVAFTAILPAEAADLSRPAYKAPPAPVAPAFSWTGCYIGGHIGGGWGRDTASVPNPALTTRGAVPPGFVIPSVSGDTSGVLGGGQIGCNYQFAPNWVIGIEGEGSGAGINGNVTATVPFNGVAISGTGHAETDWIATATGRLGYTWDRWMIYAKGGAAWAGDKYSASIPIVSESISASDTRFGWTVGGGIEWAFFNNWSAKIEYDFYDFGTDNLNFPGFLGPVPEVVPGVNIKETISAVKAGINYRF